MKIFTRWASRSFIDQFADPRALRREAKFVRHHRREPGRRGGVAHLGGLSGVQRERLLAEEVLPGPKRGHRHLVVGTGRGRDGDGVDILAFDELAPVVVHCIDAVLGCLLLGAFATAAPDARDLPPLRAEPGDVDGGAEAHADHADAERFAGHRRLCFPDDAFRSEATPRKRSDLVLSHPTLDQSPEVTGRPVALAPEPRRGARTALYFSALNEAIRTGDAMRVQDLLQAQFKQAHTVIEQVIDDCDDEALTKIVGGNIGSISAIYAHLVFDEDGWIAGVADRDRLWESGGWPSKTGLDMPGPMQTQEWAQSGPRYDLAAFREYAQEVYAATDDYLSNVSDDALDAETQAGGGKAPVARWVGAVGLWHVMSHQGEISALKGVQGLKGLPF
jgi:uncharacterized damage-inducible protein DinB